MQSIQKILCVVDPTTEEQPAHDRAVELAKAYGAELMLFASYFNQYIPATRRDAGGAFPAQKTELLAALADDLETAAERIRRQGISVRTEVRWHPSLYESIVEEASRTHADLVVKDTHYHPPLSRTLFTNTDWNLIRTCPTPLWLVKPGVSISAAPRILACVDPLHENGKPASMDRKILEMSLGIATRLSGEVHVFHAYNPLISIGNAAKWAVNPKRIAVEQLSDQIRAAHETAFTELMHNSDIPENRRHLRSGSVKELLPATIAELDVSVAVLGAVTRKNLRRLMIGSTAEKVMDHIPCDLLVLKPS